MFGEVLLLTTIELKLEQIIPILSSDTSLSGDAGKISNRRLDLDQMMVFRLLLLF